MNEKVSVRFLLLAVVFVVSLIAANLLEVKLINLFGITATAGLLVFPVSYIINDLIAEVWGYRKARTLIWVGFASYFTLMLLFQLAIIIPSPEGWEVEKAFTDIYSMAPRIAIASLTAFLVGSFLNAYVMSKMKIIQKGRNFSLRAVVSTLIGETADSLIFFPIAFGGLMPWSELFLLILTQAAMKSGYEVIVLPFTNYIVKRVKKAEQIDTFDTNISYNVFSK